jgi:hypothetical protein
MTDEEKRRRFWKIVIAAVVLWMFVIPIIAMAGFALVHYRHEKAMPSTKPAPNLIGLDLKSAETKARDAGFSIEVIGTRSDLPGPLGTIVEQIPDAGQSVYLRKVGVVTCVEDPDRKFREEQRNRLSQPPKS